MASAFGKAVGPAQVRHSRLYLDINEVGNDTSREIDVVATALGDDVALTAVVDCKGLSCRGSCSRRIADRMPTLSRSENR